MNEPKSFASLTPSLLARKGAAKPAMRPQLQPMQQFHEATARQLEEEDPGLGELGFDDLGDENVTVLHQSEVVELKPFSAEGPVAQPEVRRQQAQLPARINSLGKSAKPRRSALVEGRSAAFTLRLDANRHFQLRLACTLAGRSAQQLITEALDQMIAALPEVAELATHAAKRSPKLLKGDPQ